MDNYGCERRVALGCSLTIDTVQRLSHANARALGRTAASEAAPVKGIVVNFPARAIPHLFGPSKPNRAVAWRSARSRRSNAGKHPCPPPLRNRASSGKNHPSGGCFLAVRSGVSNAHARPLSEIEQVRAKPPIGGVFSGGTVRRSQTPMPVPSLKSSKFGQKPPIGWVFCSGTVRGRKTTRAAVSLKSSKFGQKPPIGGVFD